MACLSFFRSCQIPQSIWCAGVYFAHTIVSLTTKPVPGEHASEEYGKDTLFFAVVLLFPTPSLLSQPSVLIAPDVPKPQFNSIILEEILIFHFQFHLSGLNLWNIDAFWPKLFFFSFLKVKETTRRLVLWLYFGLHFLGEETKAYRGIHSKPRKQ